MAAKPMKPMKHQDASLAHEKSRKSVLDLSDAGTGKTAVAVWAYMRRRQKKCGALLVLCPRTLMDTVWENEFKKLAPSLKVVVATAAKRASAFSTPADVYITNHDAVTWLAKQKKEFFGKFSYLVIDEITAFKHRESQRSKAAARIKDYFEFRRGLTATPNSISIVDVWHQVYLLDDGAHLGKHFYSFRNTICEPTQGRFGVEWADRDGAEESVFGILNDMSVRHRKEECTDIPETFFTHVKYKLTKRQRELYDAMMFSRMLDKTHGIKGKVVAKHGGAVAQKVLQICSGAVYDQDKVTQVLDTTRYELVMDLAEERVRPVIFYQWTHQLEELVRLAKARKLNYAVVNGKTSDSERKSVFARYQAKLLDGLFAHPDICAHGITLTAGTSVIWPNPITDIEQYRQANARQARIGQKLKTEIVIVMAENTVEEQAYEVLNQRNAKMELLLSLFEGAAL